MTFFHLLLIKFRAWRKELAFHRKDIGIFTIPCGVSMSFFINSVSFLVPRICLKWKLTIGSSKQTGEIYIS